MFRALRHRNYRLFFIGQGVSYIGSWIQQVAMSWLAYRLTHSALLLGWVSFCNQIPSFFLTPVAGVLVDRWERHRIVLVTQILFLVQALALAVLTFSGAIQVWHLLVLGIFFGVANAFDVPARQALVVIMIDHKDDLGNAIALNSSLFNGSRLIGPAIGGVLVAAVGEGWCFLINAISFLTVIGALLLLRVKPGFQGRAPRPPLHNLKEGVVYAYNLLPIRYLLMLLAFISLVGTPYTVLMPVFATQVFQGGPEKLGILMGSSGVGAFLGALFLAQRKDVRGSGKMIVTATLLFGAGLILFAVTKSLWLSMFFLTLAGFGMLIQIGGCNILLQTIVEDDKRGRVMSFYTLALMGIYPIGCLLSGTVATYVGAPATVGLGGVGVIVAALVFASRLEIWRSHIRPIYIEKGILPGPPTPPETTLPPG